MNTSPRYIEGVDEPLPGDEIVLWSGTPAAPAVARHVLHRRVWGAYLGAMVVLVGVNASTSLPIADVVRVLVLPLFLAAAVIGAVTWLSRLIARTSRYVITSRRVVMRVGVAFPIAINIPLRLIDEVGLRTFGDGSGELRLVLAREVKIAYIALWPHLEAWRHLASPRPKLRGLAQPSAVAQALQRAIAGDAAVTGAATAGAEPRRNEVRPPSIAPGQLVTR